MIFFAGSARIYHYFCLELLSASAHYLEIPVNSYIRLLANIFFAFIISFVFADFVYFGFNFVKASPINAAICMFIGCFISSLLVCELFSISKEYNKTNRRIKKTRLNRIAKKIAMEKAQMFAGMAEKSDNQTIEARSNKVTVAISSSNSKEESLSKNQIVSNTSLIAQQEQEKSPERISISVSASSEKSTDENQHHSVSETSPDTATDEKILLRNLPVNVSQKEIEDLLAKNNITAKKIAIIRNRRGSKKRKQATVVTATITLDNTPQNDTVALLNGTMLRNQTITAVYSK